MCSNSKNRIVTNTGGQQLKQKRGAHKQSGVNNNSRRGARVGTMLVRATMQVARKKANNHGNKLSNEKTRIY